MIAEVMQLRGLPSDPPVSTVDGSGRTFSVMEGRWLRSLWQAWTALP